MVWMRLIVGGYGVVMQQLLSDAGIDINANDHAPLSRAADCGHNAVVSALLTRGLQYRREANPGLPHKMMKDKTTLSN